MSAVSNVTGVILAGGQGRRMGGVDKGLMDFKGRPVIEHIIASLRPQVAHLLINANRNVERYQHYQLQMVSDDLTGYQGPLAGFSAALQVVHTPYMMTVPCDAPFVSSLMADRLYQALIAQNADIAVAHDGKRLQPVHAMLSTQLLPSLNRFLEAGDRKIDLWYSQHKMVVVDFSDETQMFKNMNTPEQKADLEQENQI